MTITDYKVYIAGNPWKNWVFLKLETDEGIYGVGEGTINAFGKTTATAIEELSAQFLGMDPFQIEILFQKMTRDVYAEGGQIHMGAVAAVEVACWDIVGKALNQPIYNLLGGRCHEKVRAYANGWYTGERTPEGFAECAKDVVGRGYTALKFDPFGAAHRTMDPPDEDLAIDIVAAVRDAVGDKVDILIEGHSRFSVSSAIKIGRRLEPFRPTWFEEPTAHHKISATVEVARHLDVPIATGESYASHHEFAELLSHNVVDILQPEPTHLGGILATKKVNDMADAFYGVVAPHNAQGPVSTAICLQIAACTRNFLVQEIFDEFNVDWERDLVDEPAEVVDGYLEIPQRPGLGIELNFEELEKHPYHPQNFIPLFAPGWERREGARE